MFFFTFPFFNINSSVAFSLSLNALTSFILWSRILSGSFNLKFDICSFLIL